MSQWVLMFALLASAVGILLWLRHSGQGGPDPVGGVRVPAWVSRLREHLGWGIGDDGGGLAQLTRRILDEVVAQGDRTMRDRMVILPHEIVVHAAPSDVDLLNRHRQVIERDVSAEISASGERERWVSAGSLRIVDIIVDPAITAGRPLVQRAPSHSRAVVASTSPLPPALEAQPSGDYELARVDSGSDSIAVPANGGLVGRDPRRCVVVVDGPTVSREHARLLPVRDGFRVLDLESVNGVTLNGCRTTEGLLRVGDVLGLGRTVRLELRRRPDVTTSGPRAIGN